MKFNTIKSVLLVTFCVAATFATTAQGAGFTFRGDLILVNENEAAARYFGAAVDDEFTGHFIYSNAAGAPDPLEADEANYSFGGPPFGASVTDGSSPTTSPTVDVNIQNNHELTQEEVDLVNGIPGVSVTLDTPVDIWSATGLESGAFFDDATDKLTNGLYFEVAFVSLDTDLFDNLDYRPTPPTIAEVGLAILIIEEADDQGTTLFFAIGLLDVVELPELGTAALLGLAAIGLGLRRRRV